MILVHGSGPNDMDETIGGCKPFRDLARALAANGIAVLRFDKRTFIYGAASVYGTKAIRIDDEVTDDAVAAVKKVRSMPAYAESKIFILGHSLGAMMSPRIAERDGDVDGIIMMAAPARKLDAVLKEQVDYLCPSAEQRKERYEQIKAMAPVEYWRSLDDYHQTSVAKRLRIPMMIMQGERDYQVTMTDFNLWKSVMKDKTNVRLKAYPKLNHLFMEGEGKSTPLEYAKESHIPDYVIDDIAAFIDAQK